LCIFFCKYIRFYSCVGAERLIFWNMIDYVPGMVMHEKRAEPLLYLYFITKVFCCYNSFDNELI